jgi:hypothetical protein
MSGLTRSCLLPPSLRVDLTFEKPRKVVVSPMWLYVSKRFCLTISSPPGTPDSHALGGAGLSILTEASAVNRSSRITPDDLACGMTTIFRRWERSRWTFAHAQHALIGTQLAHAGRLSTYALAVTARLFPSPVAGGWQCGRALDAHALQRQLFHAQSHDRGRHSEGDRRTSWPPLRPRRHGGSHVVRRFTPRTVTCCTSFSMLPQQLPHRRAWRQLENRVRAPGHRGQPGRDAFPVSSPAAGVVRAALSDRAVRLDARRDGGTRHGCRMEIGIDVPLDVSSGGGPGQRTVEDRKSGRGISLSLSG